MHAKHRQKDTDNVPKERTAPTVILSMKLSIILSYSERTIVRSGDNGLCAQDPKIYAALLIIKVNSGAWKVTRIILVLKLMLLGLS